MRRDVPKERVFFAVVLSVSLLLLSVAMLRSDMAASPNTTRTFRDGFIVADRVTRRTETASPADIAVETANTNANKNGSPATLRKSSSDAKKATGAGASAPAAAAAAAIHVSGDNAHTTTIKMEGGDEITIKRAGTSKNKITTISTHEDGKITIENRDKHAKDPKAAATGGDDASIPQPKEKGTSDSATVVSATTIKKDPDKQQQPAATQEAGKTRAVDFVGAYEEKDGDAVYAEAGADEETATETAAAADSEEQPEEETGDNTHEIVVGKKKVTVVNVGRSQTKVSLSNVEDDDEGALEKKQTTSGR